MKDEHRSNGLGVRRAPLDLSPEEFRRVGHEMVDRIAEFFESMPERPVTSGESPAKVRQLLGRTGLPPEGMPADRLLAEAARLVFDHSLCNGHPRFWGYITSSAAPIGALADLLAAAVNPNLGAWQLSPIAAEIEGQTVQWIAEMIGFPKGCGGLMVSGGNVANFVGFFTARKNKVPWNLREVGLYGDSRRLLAYASNETHTWLQKAADLSGIGTDAIRWVKTDNQQRLDVCHLQRLIAADRAEGHLPFIVVASAGSVSTGAIDPLADIATLCKQHDLWLHVDGAYGAPAAAIPELTGAFAGLGQADSVALDPHKWLYSPLEAGCALVRNPELLRDTFSFHPVYYQFETSDEEPGINYYEYGIQNSRGFRALKVWLALRQVGRAGYVEMIRDDIALAERLFNLVDKHAELEAFTHNLSITTFRYLPARLAAAGNEADPYLNDLNRALVTQLQAEGEAFVSNAFINDRYYLRACVVNFRTTRGDIDRLPEIVTRLGQPLDAKMRPDPS
jgi:aromatic-L-amino-acid decarboxylase